MATFIRSPNFTAGRAGKSIDILTLHWMAGTLAGTDAVFQNTQTETSAHYGVENTTVHQYVRESDTAWHSGVSSINQRSIGIEHSAAPGRNASPQTIETSAQLVAEICGRYDIPIDRDHIIKHSEVYATQCPGTLPIDTIIRRAKEIIEGDNMAASEQKADELVIRLAYNLGLFRQPTDAELKNMYNRGLNVEQVMRIILEAKEHDNIGKAADAGKSSDFEQLEQTVYIKKK